MNKNYGLSKGVIEEANGRVVDYTFQLNSDGECWLHFNGITLKVEIEDLQNDRKGQKTNSKRRLQNQNNKKDKLIAPMPGKITKILVKPSDSVIAGQVILTMEAMKMEYALKADGDTLIEKVLVKESDQVTLGQELILFKQNVN